VTRLLSPDKRTIDSTGPKVAEPDPQNDIARLRAAMAAFSPTAPVNRRDLFAGRTEQMGRLIDIVSGRGEHGVVYGERGVGKTSLVSVVAQIVETPGLVSVRVNCNEKDDFSSIWKKVLTRITVFKKVAGVGFAPADHQIAIRAADALPNDVAPHDVETALTILAHVGSTVVFIDEFDRVQNQAVSGLMADTIKTLSDQGVDATVVLVGVAQNVGDLIAEHNSIERGLSQVPMPRMSPDELNEIIRRGLETVGLTIEAHALARVTGLSQGLPHYTHLLGQEAARAAVIRASESIGLGDVIAAMERAVKRSPQTLSERYHAATSTPRARTLYPDILLAAALAKGDELGYFAAADVREPLQAITKKAYGIPRFSPHLHDLTEDARGAVLQKIGSPRRVRFRFRNPLLQPYVIMRALAEQTLRVEVLDQFLG
jgi:energy-coupling factor transporter ATP-binding protein EcfA2